jgi:hypothetical protein
LTEDGGRRTPIIIFFPDVAGKMLSAARLLSRGIAPILKPQTISIITRRSLASSSGNGSGRTRARIFDKMKTEDSEPAPRGKSETYEETMSTDGRKSSNQREKSEEDQERDETARRERIQENINEKSNKRQAGVLKYVVMFTGISAIGAFLYLGEFHVFSDRFIR